MSDGELRAKIDAFQAAASDDTDVIDIIDVVADTIAVTDVNPSSGTSFGGTVVELTADPLGDDVKVSFGGAEATILSVEGNVVVVQTPPGVDGPTDVEVGTSTGVGAASEAYSYWPDAKMGVLGSYSVLYPQLDLVSATPVGYTWFMFVEPTATSYQQLFTDAPVDSCVSNFEPAWDLIHPMDVGADSATLKGGGAEQSVPFQLEEEMFSINYEYSDPVFEPKSPDQDLFLIDDWHGDASYGLTLDGVRSPFEEKIDPFFRTPVPLELLGPSLEGTGSLLVGTVDVEWVDENSGDYVVIVAIRVQGYGPDLVELEKVTCVVEDDGEFRIPRGVWSAFAEEDGEYLYLQVGRVMESDDLLAHNHSKNGVVGVYWAAQVVVVGDVLNAP